MKEALYFYNLDLPFPPSREEFTINFFGQKIQYVIIGGDLLFRCDKDSRPKKFVNRLYRDKLSVSWKDVAEFGVDLIDSPLSQVTHLIECASGEQLLAKEPLNKNRRIFRAVTTVVDIPPAAFILIDQALKEMNTIKA